MDNDIAKEERRNLVEMQYQNSIFLDKWLLTLSAGVFSLSVAFIKNVVGKQPSSPALLMCSWSAFCACIIVTLTSYLLAFPAYDRQITIVEQDKNDKNVYRKPMVWLNIAAVTVFSIGVISLAIFAFLNL